jgi:hypothetical protein
MTSETPFSLLCTPVVAVIESNGPKALHLQYRQAMEIHGFQRHVNISEFQHSQIIVDTQNSSPHTPLLKNRVLTKPRTLPYRLKKERSPIEWN